MLLTLTDFDYVSGAGYPLDDEQLKAKLACEDIVVTSLALIDSGQADKVRALFVEDGAHTLNDAEFEGPALTRFLDERQAMAGRNTRHTIENLLFRMTAPDRAFVRSICVVYLLSLEEEAERRVPRGIVDFKDSFAKQPDGRWLLTRREANLVAGVR